MTKDQSLTELERRSSELKARALQQQQQLAETMVELRAITRMIRLRKPSSKRVVPLLLTSAKKGTFDKCAEGGRKRMQMLTPEQRSEQGRKGASVRTANRLARQQQLLVQAST
ncbi:MAG: hypothetical protein EOP83_04040 [Verrucomicrobiaceae bacterium]|nr:MAG: hypothetical protein EOP83_04040 [Verrucomicrobiaceae bacterium]